MSLRLQELCAILVEDTCGQLCSQIFVALAESGRLSRLQLQNLTLIPSNQLKQSLAILAQQRLLLHYTADDDITFYQLDWRNTYHLIRSSRFVTLVEDRHGTIAGHIVDNLLRLGHARVGDLAQAFELSQAAKRDSENEECEVVNGDSEVNGVDSQHKPLGSNAMTLARFHNTLRALLHTGFLVKVGKRAHMPSADLQAEIEEAVISDSFPDRKVTGPKKQNEFRAAVNSLKRKWRDADDFSESRDLEWSADARRAGMPPRKRSKPNGVHVNGTAHFDNMSDLDGGPAAKVLDDLVLQINFARLTLASRTNRLEQFAHSHLGGAASYVYGALLQVLEAKIRDRDDNMQIFETEEDEEDEDEDVCVPTASTIEVAATLDPSVDLSCGIIGLGEPERLPNNDPNPKKKGKRLDPEFADIGIKVEEQSDDEDRSATSHRNSHKHHLSLVEEHLKLLAEHTKRFCRRVGAGGHGEWRVDFPTLTDILIHAEIDSTVLARFGRNHTRIIRLLRERGRLEEKQVAALSFMKMKEVRAVLTQLQYAGLVEAQEVPRDTSRHIQRTAYLWFHDQARVQSLLLQQTYQAMSRVLQRLKQEQETYRNAIIKAELLDDKEEALLPNEKADLLQWREVEEKLLIQLQKMDDMVALLRDYSGKDTSLVS